MRPRGTVSPAGRPRRTPRRASTRQSAAGVLKQRDLDARSRPRRAREATVRRVRTHGPVREAPADDEAAAVATQRAAAGRIGQVRAVEAQPVRGLASPGRGTAARPTPRRGPSPARPRRGGSNPRSHPPARGRDRLHPHLASRARAREQPPRAPTARRPSRRRSRWSPRRRRPARPRGSSPARRSSPSEIWCSSVPERRSKTISAPSVDATPTPPAAATKPGLPSGGTTTSVFAPAGVRSIGVASCVNTPCAVTESGGHSGSNGSSPTSPASSRNAPSGPRRTAAPARSGEPKSRSWTATSAGEAASHMTSRRGTGDVPERHRRTAGKRRGDEVHDLARALSPQHAIAGQDRRGTVGNGAQLRACGRREQQQQRRDDARDTKHPSRL